jgi:hypothetical protein
LRLTSSTNTSPSTPSRPVHTSLHRPPPPPPHTHTHTHTHPPTHPPTHIPPPPPPHQALLDLINARRPNGTAPLAVAAMPRLMVAEDDAEAAK